MLETEPGVVQILTSFRDFTTVLWLLHARDTLSTKLRQKENYLNSVNYQDYVRVRTSIFMKNFKTSLYKKCLLFLYFFISNSVC